MRKPLLLDLFAGCGGASMGYYQAGFEVVGVDLFAQDNYPFEFHQADALTYPLQGFDVIHASPPCFPSGSMVLTSNGKIPIELCLPDMEVVTHRGRLKRVKRIFKRCYHGRLFTIETKYGRKPFTCTPEHPIWTRRCIIKVKDTPTRKNSLHYKTYADPEWIEAKDLHSGDLVCEPHLICQQELSIPKVIMKQSIRLNAAYDMETRLIDRDCQIAWKTNEMAWLLGFYLAEGHVRGRNPTKEDKGPYRREVIYSVADKEATDLAKKLSDVGLHAIVQKHSQGSSRVTVTSVDFWALCHVMGKYADGKYIPPAFLCMHHEWQKQFLDGYLTGDGYLAISKRTKSQNHSATTISWDITIGIARMIALVYGVVASIRICYPAGASQIQGRDIQVKETYSVGYVLPTTNKVRPGLVDEHGAWLPIKNISISDPLDTDVYNMEVEEDNSYTVEGFAVHNCQAFSLATGFHPHAREKHPDYIDIMRKRLQASGKPYIIENVIGSPVERSIMLCGAMFDLRVYRHRLFESNILLFQPHHPRHTVKAAKPGAIAKPDEFWCVGGHFGQKDEAQKAMGIWWMKNQKAIANAIPPSYTKYIGEQLMAALEHEEISA